MKRPKALAFEIIIRLSFSPDFVLSMANLGLFLEHYKLSCLAMVLLYYHWVVMCSSSVAKIFLLAH